jgi:hypothetical protein
MLATAGLPRFLACSAVHCTPEITASHEPAPAQPSTLTWYKAERDRKKLWASRAQVVSAFGGGGSVYGDDGGVLGYAIAMAGHDARDVRAMAVAIKVALVAKVGAPLGSASELDVAR